MPEESHPELTVRMSQENTVTGPFSDKHFERLVQTVSELGERYANPKEESTAVIRCPLCEREVSPEATDIRKIPLKHSEGYDYVHISCLETAYEPNNPNPLA